MSLHLFKFREAIPNRYLTALPSYFHISNSTTLDVLVIRLLTSTIDIEIRSDRSRIVLDKNFFELPKVTVSRKSTKQIRETLEPFKFDEYSRYSKKFYGRNINFYNNLLNELTFYFVYSSKSQNQSAFVNLYRILEFVSYSFPLIHASNYGNYAGSFNALKEYFTDDKVSEIKFFEKFIHNIFRGTSYLGYSTVFDFSSSDSVISSNSYDIFYSLLKPTDWLVADPITFTLSVENAKLINLFKITRNRYFHFAIGGWQRNIQNSDLKDPDFFFKKINDCFLNWIVFIYREIIQESVDNSIF